MQTGEAGVQGQRRAAVWRWATLLGLALALPGWLTPAAAQVAAPAAQRIEVFVREGCPHCAKAEEFLAVLGREQPQLDIVIRDVNREPAALQRLTELAREHGGVARVPAFFLADQLLFGFSEAARTDLLIRNVLAGQRTQRAAAGAAGAAGSTCELADAVGKASADPNDVLLKPCPLGGHAEAAAVPAPPERFEIGWFGRTLSLDDIGLPLFTLAIGTLDGFNPCSMWVLLLMISLLAPLNDRPRMLAIAGTFVAIQGIAYFIFLAAWLNLFLLIGLARWSQILIAVIAIVAGLINLKDFLAFKWGGISLSIPDQAKPGIYNRMRNILHARSMTAAVAGAVVLAVLVQIVELLCTSGFPALFTRILTLEQLEPSSYYGYLLLYMAAYMFDDVLVLGTGVVLLSRHRLQEREGRVLKLLAGLAMVGLGVYLLLE
ncbi:MAG: NrdH-redoxin [Burkholderiales bacterium]|nr:NrdH-redoxin [Burkholderiales bacterium]